MFFGYFFIFRGTQIVSMQSLHYLTLAILVPPLLSMFAESTSLNYEGGAANVGEDAFCYLSYSIILTQTHRYDYGLARDGRCTNSAMGAWNRAVELVYMGLEQRQESRTWLDRRPMGWED
jgi:hypothetical protein